MNFDENEFSDIASLDKEGIVEATLPVFSNRKEGKTDLRPRAFCTRTKKSYLVDSGAALSVLPRAWLPAGQEVTVDPAVTEQLREQVSLLRELQELQRVHADRA